MYTDMCHNNNNGIGVFNIRFKKNIVFTCCSMLADTHIPFFLMRFIT